MTLCSWTGKSCSCGTFPYRRDGLLPLECEKRVSLDMIHIRSVRPPLKALYQLYLQELKNETYNPKDLKWLSIGSNF
jgi:hypothetical protein